MKGGRNHKISNEVLSRGGKLDNNKKLNSNERKSSYDKIEKIQKTLIKKPDHAAGVLRGGARRGIKKTPLNEQKPQNVPKRRGERKQNFPKIKKSVESSFQIT